MTVHGGGEVVKLSMSCCSEDCDGVVRVVWLQALERRAHCVSRRCRVEQPEGNELIPSAVIWMLVVVGVTTQTDRQTGKETLSRCQSVRVGR